MRKVTAVSLFSGAGGLDLGVSTAGVKIAACIDIDKDSVETLSKNKHYEKAALFNEDLSTFDTKRFLSPIKKTRRSGLIVVGGPPCQPFSKNGYWVKNKNRLVCKDPRNMMSEYFRVIEELQPDGFMLENVESLIHPTNKHVLESICEASDQLGYYFAVHRVNAADFGVPQRRKRVFLFGSRSKITGAPEPTHRSKVDDDLFNDLPSHVGVGSFIKPFASKKYHEPYEIAEGGTYYEDLKQVPSGKNYIALTANAGYKNPKFVAGKRFWNFLLKLHPDEPSWTIAAQPGPWVGPFHWDNRRLRVPEIAAIQTFPKDYKFAGSRRSIQRQLGNAVPVLLGQHMTSFLLKNL